MTPAGGALTRFVEGKLRNNVKWGKETNDWNLKYIIRRNKGDWLMPSNLYHMRQE